MTAHPVDMSRKARPHPKTPRAKTFIKAWRKNKGFTLVQLSERLEALHGILISDSQLSRIERGEQPYNQDLLEAIAEALGTVPASLIMRDPTAPDALWELLDSLRPQERIQAAEVIKALKRTGTDG